MDESKSTEEIVLKKIEEAERTGATELDLSGLGLSSLPPQIGTLENLRMLNLGRKERTEVVSGEREVAEGYFHTIFRVETYYENMIVVHSNHIIKLPAEIGNLFKLTSLNLGGNQLTSLPHEIGQLANLTELDLSHNQLTSLPPELRSLKALKRLDLRDNLLTVPPEILEKVTEPQAILNYLVIIGEGKRRPLAETKMLVVGQGGVGKTSLIHRLTNNTFNPSETKTDGIAINRWQVPNSQTGENQPESLRVNIWDFGGQEIMHATHQFFLTQRSLYLLVLDARTEEENRLEYWLKIIQSFGGESPILIVGNKIDQHSLDIDRTGLQKKYPNIVGIIETSAASGVGLEELRSAIVEQVNKLPHVRDAIPEAWFNVKNQIEDLGREQNYISQERYEEKCRELKVHDELSQHTLISFLHDLGVVLYFQDNPRLEALGILNPQWVTNGVYKILNAKALFQNKGVLNLSMLAGILDASDYPSHNRLFIVDMMKKFELCLDVEPDKVFLVPDLLPKDEPPTSDWEDVLAFQYLYSVLPSSVMTRFIVRMNRQIAEKLVWRSGVVLELEDNRVLVKADGEERRLSILVNGAKHTRRDVLAAVRQQLDDIHSSIKGLMPKRKIPIPEHSNVEPLDYEYLLQLERNGFREFPVKDGDELILVDVKKILNGLESEEVRSTIIIGGNVENSKIVLGNANVLNL